MIRSRNDLEPFLRQERSQPPALFHSNRLILIAMHDKGRGRDPGCGF